MNTRNPGYLLLEDGSRYDGLLAGAAPSESGATAGEVVFTTVMAGYHELVTDPDARDQLLVFAYPLIGNYGVAHAFAESQTAQAAAVITRELATPGDGREQGDWEQWLTDNGVPAITGVNTRALIRRIRGAGMVRGGVFPATTEQSDAAEQLARAAASGPADGAGAGGVRQVGDGERAFGVVIDCGAKRSVLASLTERDVRLELHPPTSTLAELTAREPDFFFVSNGPGDPSEMDIQVELIRGLLGVRPVWGVGLGHQLIARALGLTTQRLAAGHHGANHPVKDLRSGKVEITAQHHEFTVLTPDGQSTCAADQPPRWQSPHGEAEITHVNLYDRTVEGLELAGAAAVSLQYHPETGPPPHGSREFFDRLVSEVGA